MVQVGVMVGYIFGFSNLSSSFQQLPSNWLLESLLNDINNLRHKTAFYSNSSRIDARRNLSRKISQQNFAVN